MTAKCEHELQSLDDAELADLRRQARKGRPPMAWVEEGYRCSRCQCIVAAVSWYGQVYRVPVEQSEEGAVAVRWPKRSDAAGGAISMG